MARLEGRKVKNQGIAGKGADQQAPSSAPAARHDAFISYSHAADGALAPRLRNGLQRFATPWRVFRWVNPSRSLRVFQDQASLSANPALWPAIEAALGSAEWFILLASPEAASSPWVDREVDFWCRNRPVEKLLIVQTEGEIGWDAAAGDFDWTRTTALPRRLSGAFRDEPRWIDARWARSEAHASLRDPRFRDLVAELAAPLHGVPKDELIGEDIRQARRLNRWRNAALGVVSLLLVAAIGAAAVAERRLATAQRSQSRALAALAEFEAETGSPATAIRLALAGMPRDTGNPDRAYSRRTEGSLWYSLQRLRELRRYHHDHMVRSIAFSPDGRLLATASGPDEYRSGFTERTARLWDVATGREVVAFAGHEDMVVAVAFSPDGKTLATGSDDNTARLWEVATGREIRSLRGHENQVNSVAFSPDGRTLATSSWDQTVRLWDVAAGREIGGLPGYATGVHSVAFSPDGGFLATGDDDLSAKLWDLKTRTMVREFKGHTHRVYSVAFSPDGRSLATGSQDGTTRLWEVATGREVLAFTGHGLSVAFSPDGRVLAHTSGTSRALLVDLETGGEIGSLGGHEGYVMSLAFSPDGRTLATGSSDKTARLWQLASTEEAMMLGDGEHTRASGSSAFSPDGTVLATSDALDNTAWLWDVATGRALRPLQGHAGFVFSKAFSPDGRTLATGAGDGTARLWEVASGTEIAVLRGHEDKVVSVAFSPDGRFLATASSDNTARLWEVATGLEIRAFRGHASELESVAFSPDGRFLATIGWDGTARLWALETGHQASAIPVGNVDRHAVAFSPDGRAFATSSDDNTARLWEVATGREIRTFRGHEENVNVLAFSPSGRSLATGSDDDTARLWEVATGREVRALRGHDGNVTSIAFSPDGKILATGSDDWWARLWETETGEEIASTRYYREVVKSFNFRQDGLVIAIDADAVRPYRIGQGLIDFACARVHELPVSEREKERFGIEDEWCTPDVSAALRARLGLAPRAVNPMATAAAHGSFPTGYVAQNSRPGANRRRP